MDDLAWRDSVLRGDSAVEFHKDVLRWASLGGLNTVFDVADDLRSRGFSFGSGDLKFNRTLDVFYVVQLFASNERQHAKAESEDAKVVDQPFEEYYAEYEALLHEDVWKQYYSRRFLLNPASVDYWRLPNLRDLPDASDPWGCPRQKGPDHMHFSKLPYWAYNVNATHWRQPTVPTRRIAQIALATLNETIKREQQDDPGVESFSETQARFWLQECGLLAQSHHPEVVFFMPYRISEQIARGHFDVLAWQKSYSLTRWSSIEARHEFMPADADSSKYRRLRGTGWPDGGTGRLALEFGWQPEVGSEEEVEFLTAVAIEELEGIADMNSLDYKSRSHILMGVLCVAYETTHGTDGIAKADLASRCVAAGRFIDESTAQHWIQRVLDIAIPYVPNLDGD